MLEDVYKGYIDAGKGSTYPSELILSEKYKENSDYALGVELSSRAYFLLTSDTSSEYDSDVKSYSAVENQINELYPGTVISSDELFSAPLWEMRPFSSPDIEIFKRFNFVKNFIDAEASDVERKERFFTGANFTWFKIKYFNFIEEYSGGEKSDLNEFAYCISTIEKRFPHMLNENLLEVLAEENVSKEKLLKIDTIFNFSEGSYLENSILKMMDIKPLS